MYYVHFTINIGQREYALTLPKVKSLDRTVEFLKEQYPEATSMALSLVFDANDDSQSSSPKGERITKT